MSIVIKKNIYWHFAVYAGDEDSIDPSSLPGSAVSTLDLGDNVIGNGHIKNAVEEAKAYAIVSGDQRLVEILCENGTVVEDDGDFRYAIRSTNVDASPGFAWFDLTIDRLTELFGNPVEVETVSQLYEVNNGNNNGARKKIRSILFAVHKEGESGSSGNGEPDSYFDYTNIPSEVVIASSASYQELVRSMSPKTFVDQSGLDSGFFINIKRQEEISRLGCCDIFPTGGGVTQPSSSSSSSSSGAASSSSSSSGASSSSSSSQSGCGGGTICASSPSNTTRVYYCPESNKRIWAVRQTADIHFSNNPIMESPLVGETILKSNIIKRREIFSELIWADVSLHVGDNNLDWSNLRWNHAGYINFRNNMPTLSRDHILPKFNKKYLSSYGDSCSFGNSYNYDIEMPIAIQSISFDSRGFLWALCSGGFRDFSTNNQTIDNIETTEGIYRIIPGGWKKKAANAFVYGGSVCDKKQTDSLNKSILADFNSNVLFGTSYNGDLSIAVGVDGEGHLRIWREEKDNAVWELLPEENELTGTDGKILSSITDFSVGYGKVAAISDNKLYLWGDLEISSQIDNDLSNQGSFIRVAIAKDFVVAFKNDGSFVLYVNLDHDTNDASNLTQDELDDLSTLITGSSIAKIRCGKKHVSVLTSSGKLHIRGKKGDDKVFNGSYSASLINGIDFNLNYKDINCFDGVTLASREDANSTIVDFMSEKVSIKLNGVDSSIDSINSYLINGIRDYYALNNGKSETGIKKLIDSCGLIGLAKLSDDTYSSDNINVYGDSNLIHCPLFKNEESNFDDKLKIGASLYGWKVSYSPNGEYVAVSAPGEGGGYLDDLNDDDVSLPRGSVYVFKKSDINHRYEVFQIINHLDNSSARYRFGKHLCFVEHGNSLKLFVSFRNRYSPNSIDMVSIYELSNERFIYINDVAPKINVDNFGADYQIMNMKSYGKFLILCQKFSDTYDGIGIVPGNVSYADAATVSIIDCSSTASSEYDQASGVYIHFSNIDFSIYFDVSLVSKDETVNVFVTNPSGASVNSITDIKMSSQLSPSVGLNIEVDQPSVTDSGCIYSLAFKKVGENFVFATEDSNIYRDFYYEESSTLQSDSMFGFSISSSESCIVVGSPYVSNEKGNNLGSIFSYYLDNYDNADAEFDVLKISTSSRQIVNFEELLDKNLSINYSLLSLDSRNFGAFVKLVSGPGFNERLIVSACGTDEKISESQDGDFPGEIYIFERNSSGLWEIVGSHSYGFTGDRFGKHFDVAKFGSGFDICVGISGFAASDNDYSCGLVKIINMPGDNAIGCLPSNKMMRYDDPDSAGNSQSSYLYKNVSLGKKHIFSILGGSKEGHYTWDYDFATLVERSLINKPTGLDLRNIRVAKFIKDPVDNSNVSYSYSDMGSFIVGEPSPSMQLGSDVYSYRSSLYLEEDKTIRVMEAHIRPFRQIDVSSTNFNVFPQNVEQIDQINDDDYMTDAGGESHYSPIVVPSGGSGSIWPTGTVAFVEPGYSFAFSPVRSQRWMPAVKDWNINIYNLYNTKISYIEYINNFSPVYNGGFRSFPKDLESVNDPVIPIRNINLQANSPGFESKWISSYISPGCIQIIDSGYEGGIELHKPDTANSSPQNVGNIACLSTNPQLSKLMRIAKDRNSDPNYGWRDHSVDWYDMFSYQIAYGGINITYRDLNNSRPVGYNSKIFSVSKFLGWSGCTLSSATDASSILNNVEEVYLDSVSLNGGASYVAGPPLLIKIPFTVTSIQFTGSLNFTYWNSYKNGFEDENLDITNSTDGWVRSTSYPYNYKYYFTGKKDAVIHGIFNPLKDQNIGVSFSNSAYPVDRRSQLITRISGWGSSVERIGGYEQDLINKFSVFYPSISFGCILDKRLSDSSSFANNFVEGQNAGQTSIGISTPSTIEANLIAPWVSQSDPRYGQNEEFSYNRIVAPTDTIYITNYTQSQIDSLNNIYEQYWIYDSSRTFNEFGYFAFGQIPSQGSNNVKIRVNAMTFVGQDGQDAQVDGFMLTGVKYTSRSYSLTATSIPGYQDSGLFEDAIRGPVIYKTNSSTAGGPVRDTYVEEHLYGPASFPWKFNGQSYSFNERFGNVMRYPYKTSILTGRGRCIQVSPFGDEVKMIGRSEIVYQNEFIYRRILWSKAEYYAKHFIKSFTLPLPGSQPIGVLDSRINLPLGSNSVSHNGSASVIDQHVTNVNGNCFTGSNYIYQHTPRIIDAERPLIIENDSIVCLPTFNLDKILSTVSDPSQQSASHIFATIVKEYSGNVSYPNNSESKFISFSRSQFLINNNVSDIYCAQVGLGSSQSNINKYAMNNAESSAILKCISLGYTHIIDVNSSCIQNPNNSDIIFIAVSLLTSVPARGVLDQSSSSTVSYSHSVGVSSTGENIKGGGLIALIFTAEYSKSQDKILPGTWNSTCENVSPNIVNGNHASSRNIKDGISAVYTTSNCPARNGIWMQPLLGLKIKQDELSPGEPSPNENYSANTPHYWPGSHVRVNSSTWMDEWRHPSETSQSPMYYASPPGFLRIPINRSWLTKLGKVKLMYSSAGGSVGYMLAVGPYVFSFSSNSPAPVAENSDPKSLWHYAISDSSQSTFPIPSYDWDLRPVVFQRFGVNLSETSETSVFDKVSLDDSQIKDSARKLKSFFNLEEYTNDEDNIGNSTDKYFFSKEVMHTGVPSYDDVLGNNSFAMLGEGHLINLRSNGKILPVIFWRGAFYRIEHGIRPNISKVSIQFIDNASIERMEKAYAYHRLSSFYNEKGSFVVVGNDNVNTFVYIFKINANEVDFNTFTLDISLSHSSISSVSQVKPISNFTASIFDNKCNQAHNFSIWMSEDSSIMCIGKHRWESQSTPHGQSRCIFVDAFRKLPNGSYQRVSQNDFISGNDIVAIPPNAAIESMCSSIVANRNGNIWNIHCISGQDSNEDYINNPFNNIPRFTGKIHSFSVSASQILSQAIELTDLDDFDSLNSSAFSSMNFWASTPMSAKNGSCGMCYDSSRDRMMVSTFRSIIDLKLNDSNIGSSIWMVDRSYSPAPSFDVASRFKSPYISYGLDSSGNSTSYASPNDRIRFEVPAVQSVSSPLNDNTYAQKISIVKYNSNNSSLISICNNLPSIIRGQVGINSEIEGLYDAVSINPAYRFLNSSDKRSYDPSLLAWVFKYDLSPNSSNRYSLLGYNQSGYLQNIETMANIMVRSPVDINSNISKNMYFAGSESLKLDVSQCYRDFNVNHVDVLGTLMQMDWHDIAGILSWTSNEFYVMRSYDYSNHSYDDSSFANEEAAEDFVNSWLKASNYNITSNGINYNNINGIIKFSIPSNSSVNLEAPVKVTGNHSGDKGVGMCGPSAITVAACSNFRSSLSGDSLDYGSVKDCPSILLPLLKNRRIFSSNPLRMGVIIQDDSSINQPLVNQYDYENVLKIGKFFNRNDLLSERFNFTDKFVANSMVLSSNKNFPSQSYFDRKQSGISLGGLVHRESDGYAFYSSKTKISSSYLTKWNVIIDNIGKSLDPDFGSVFNDDRLWIARLSYINGLIDSSHPYAGWNYVPNISGDGISTVLLPRSCSCKDLLVNASISLSKWKTVFASSGPSTTGGNANILSIISGDNPPIKNRVNTSSVNDDKLTDLVLIGDLKSVYIQNALGNSSSGSFVNSVYNQLYAQNSSPIMHPNGVIHIVDTDSSPDQDIDDVKQKFVKAFFGKFKGFYTRLSYGY